MVILSRENTIANQFMAELRDAGIQKDSLRFRKNLERLGEVLAYEISKTLPYHALEVQTQLGTAAVNVPKQQPVLATVMRAGLPFYQGFLNMFDKAESAFIGAYRGAHSADYSFEVEMEYIACPNLEGKTLILIDPMLATGQSLLKTAQGLLRWGSPAQIHVAAAIASRTGVAFLQEHLPGARIWAGAVDEELNHQFYIVPGLGDAGDLAFGGKL